MEEAFAKLCKDSFAAMPGNRLKEQIKGGWSFALIGKPGKFDEWEKLMNETGPID